MIIGYRYDVLLATPYGRNWMVFLSDAEIVGMSADTTIDISRVRELIETTRHFRGCYLRGVKRDHAEYNDNCLEWMERREVYQMDIVKITTYEIKGDQSGVYLQEIV